MHTKLSVNINKIATLRNARGGNLPDLLQVAKDCERFGAEGITVHPRPDERHIRFDDVRNLKKIIATGLNIEGFPNERFLNLIEEVQPEQCTLVPDAEHVITSNEGWDIKTHEKYLAKIVAQIKKIAPLEFLFLSIQMLRKLNLQKKLEQIELKFTQAILRINFTRLINNN